MDAEQTLAFLRAQNREEVTLSSGRRYTIRRPDLMRLMAFGDIPLPALKQASEAAESNGKTEVTGEQRLAMQSMFDFDDRLLAEGIEQIEGEDVEMTVDAVKLLMEDDRAELLEYLKREKVSPKAGSPA